MPVYTNLLTILTDPIPYGGYFVTEHAKQILRIVRNTVKPPPAYMRSRYRGHFVVTRSLVEGLQKLGYPFNYNPKKLSDLADVVIVLSGVSTLRQAIALKRRGLIKKLLAGPNLIVFPSDHGAIICSPEVDVCVTPGPLTCDIYTEDCPSLIGRCVGWPAGVDTTFWSPGSGEREKLVLIYNKPHHGPTQELAPYIEAIEAKGYAVQLVKYGKYTRSEYLSMLRKASLMVGFSDAESQGIAWAEAWAVDVPTLMWLNDRHSYNHPRSVGRTFKVSSAPYLSEDTGDFFRDMAKFKSAFDSWVRGETTYRARQWVLQNMSDETCAIKLWKIAMLDRKVIEK